MENYLNDFVTTDVVISEEEEAMIKWLDSWCGQEHVDIVLSLVERLSNVGSWKQKILYIALLQMQGSVERQDDFEPSEIREKYRITIQERFCPKCKFPLVAEHRDLYYCRACVEYVPKKITS